MLASGRKAGWAQGPRGSVELGPGDPDAVPGVQLQVRGGSPAELHPAGPASVQREVHPNLDPEMGDALDEARLATEAGVVVQHEVVGSGPIAIELGGRPGELHDELIGRMVIHVDREGR